MPKRDSALKETPRTDAVYAANAALGYGSIVRIPEGHPPSDPWELARQLERELAEAREGWGNEKLRRIEANELLSEVARSGVVFDDSRVGYVEVQIDRETWNNIRSASKGNV